MKSGTRQRRLAVFMPQKDGKYTTVGGNRAMGHFYFVRHGADYGMWKEDLGQQILH